MKYLIIIILLSFMPLTAVFARPKPRVIPERIKLMRLERIAREKRVKDCIRAIPDTITIPGYRTAGGKSRVEQNYNKVQQSSECMRNTK